MIDRFTDIPVYAADYLTYLLAIRGLSEKTVSQYYFDLRVFFRYLLCRTRRADENDFDTIDASGFSLDELRALTLSDLYAFLDYATRGRGNDTKARARKISALRSFYKYLDRNAMINDNPTRHLDTPKDPVRMPVYLSYEEAVRLLGSVIGGKNEARDLCILTFFLNCGIRLSELVGINLNDIRGRNLRVIGKGNKERMLFLNDACMDVLERYTEVRKTLAVKGKDENALFVSRNNRRISVRAVENLVDKYLTAAGLDVEKYSPHKLRHTAATLMFQNGVDVRVLQEVLGHANLGTTQIYTHLENKQVQKALENNPLSKKKP